MEAFRRACLLPYRSLETEEYRNTSESPLLENIANMSDSELNNKLKDDKWIEDNNIKVDTSYEYEEDDLGSSFKVRSKTMTISTGGTFVRKLEIFQTFNKDIDRFASTDWYDTFET